MSNTSGDDPPTPEGFMIGILHQTLMHRFSFVMRQRQEIGEGGGNDDVNGANDDGVPPDIDDRVLERLTEIIVAFGVQLERRRRPRGTSSEYLDNLPRTLIGRSEIAAAAASTHHHDHQRNNYATLTISRTTATTGGNDPRSGQITYKAVPITFGPSGRSNATTTTTTSSAGSATVAQSNEMNLVEARLVVAEPLTRKGCSFKGDWDASSVNSSAASLIVYMEKRNDGYEQSVWAQLNGAAAVILGVRSDDNNNSNNPFAVDDSENRDTSNNQRPSNTTTTSTMTQKKKKRKKTSRNTCQLQIPVVAVKASSGTDIASLFYSARNAGKELDDCNLTFMATDNNNSDNNNPNITTEDDCVICQDSFEVGQTMLTLPDCGHYYHENCLIQWLTSHHTCPVCRVELPVATAAATAAPAEEGQNNGDNNNNNSNNGGVDRNEETITLHQM